MTALAANSNRNTALLAVSAGTRLPLTASSVPFVGSLLSMDSTGYVHPLVAGERFVGVATEQVLTMDWIKVTPAAGDIAVQCVSGIFILRNVTGPSAAVTDAGVKRKVYASDDNTFTYTASGNSLIGKVINYNSDGSIDIACCTNDRAACFPGSAGVVAYTDAATSVSTADLDKIIIAPITVGRTYTLPASAALVGHTFTFQSSGAFALTVAAAGAEKIGGAASIVMSASTGATITVMATGVAGSEWVVIGSYLVTNTFTQQVVATAAYADTGNISASDINKVLLCTPTNPATYTLPAVATVTIGGIYVFVSLAAKQITLQGNGGTEKICSAAGAAATTLTLASATAGANATIMCTAHAGEEWVQV